MIYLGGQVLLFYNHKMGNIYSDHNMIYGLESVSNESS